MKQANRSIHHKWFGRQKQVEYQRLSDQLWLMSVSSFCLHTVSLSEAEFAALKAGSARNGSLVFSSSLWQMGRFVEQGYEPVQAHCGDKPVELAFLKDTPGYTFHYRPVTSSKDPIPDGMQIVEPHSWLLVEDAVRPTLTFDLQTGAIYHCLIPVSILPGGDYDITINRELLIEAIRRGRIKPSDVDCRGRINRNARFCVRIGREAGFINIPYGDQTVTKKIHYTLNPGGILKTQPLQRSYCTLDSADDVLVVADSNEDVLYELDRRQPSCAGLGLNYPFVLRTGDDGVYNAADIEVDTTKPVQVVLALDGTPQLSQNTLNQIARLPGFRVVKPFTGKLEQHQLVLFCDQDYFKADHVPIDEVDPNYELESLRKYRWYGDLSKVYVKRDELKSRRYPSEVLAQFKHLPLNLSRQAYTIEELRRYDQLVSSGYVLLTRNSWFSLYDLKLYVDSLLQSETLPSFTTSVGQSKMIKAQITFRDLFENLKYINYHQHPLLVITVHGRESSFCKYVLPKLARSEMESLVILREWQKIIQEFENQIPD